MPETTYKNNLYMPTLITKLNDKYFIVDCHHHRIIYNYNLKDSISKWKQIDFELAGCHTITSNGDIYMVDNTGLNEIIVFDKDLKFKQKFINVGDRPHKVEYDKNTNLFYAISSLTQEMYIYKYINEKVVLDAIIKLTFLNSNDYTRSFSIIDNYMYIVTNQGNIHKINYVDKSFSLVETYTVPDEIAGLNQIYKIGEYFYIINTQNKNGDVIPSIIKCKYLNKINENENLYNNLDIKNTQYFSSQFDNRYYLTEIGNDENSII